MFDSPVGVVIKSAREKQGLTQTQLAEAVGVHLNTIHGWETGKRVPDVVSFFKLADTLRIFTRYSGECQHFHNILCDTSPRQFVRVQMKGEIFCPMVGQEISLQTCPKCPHFRGVNVMDGHEVPPSLVTMCAYGT